MFKSILFDLFLS